jgi:hypothetical protein
LSRGRQRGVAAVRGRQCAFGCRDDIVREVAQQDPHLVEAELHPGDRAEPRVERQPLARPAGPWRLARPCFLGGLCFLGGPGRRDDKAGGRQFLHHAAYRRRRDARVPGELRPAHRPPRAQRRQHEVTA